jgi:hypothetical protein
VVRLLWVVICAIAIASSGCTTRMGLQTSSSKKNTASKKSAESKSITLVPLTAESVIPQTVNSKKDIESKDSTKKPRSEAPIPLPAAPLLSPQPEPNCEVETTGSNTNERQKLDYERQCYRHAEMIVRDRLQHLQDAVDKTISANNGTPIPLPAASLLSPQPQPVCETTDTKADERQKLDYERQCYRHAEMIVRSRLLLLQDSVDKTIGAFNRSERGGP